MVARFAGARSLDDRRRRRIATQPLEQEGTESNVNLASLSKNSQDSQSAKAASNIASVPATPLDDIEFPVRKLISRKPWKIGLACIAMLGVAGLLIATADYFSRSASPSATAVEAMFRLPDGQAIRVFCGVMLIFCAQLSFVIGWARSQSQNDFHGHYRIWRWNALWLFGIAIGVLIDFPTVFSDAMSRWGGDFSRYPAEIFWLLPVSFAGSVLVWNLVGEMRESQFARLCYWGTLAGTVFLLAMRYATGISIPVESPRFMSLVVSLASVCLLFVSMLMHCRHVLYRSVDPPERTNSFALQSLSIVGSILLKISKVFQSSESESSTEKKSNEKRSAEKKKVETQTAEDVAVETLQPKSTRKRSSSPVEKQTAAEPASEAASAKKETVTRIDEPLDPASLKGLSKKQRRKLRQEHRRNIREQSEEMA